MAREQLTSIAGVSLTSSSTTQEHELGMCAQDNVGNSFRYIQNILADSLALADGSVVYPTVTHGVVTSDYTGGSGIGAKVVGVAVSAIVAGSYGWVQVSGYHDAVYTDGGVTAGDYLIGHTVDGEADTMAAGEEHLVFGVAMATDTGTPEYSPAQIYCL